MHLLLIQNLLLLMVLNCATVLAVLTINLFINFKNIVVNCYMPVFILKNVLNLNLGV